MSAHKGFQLWTETVGNCLNGLINLEQFMEKLWIRENYAGVISRNLPYQNCEHKYIYDNMYVTHLRHILLYKEDVKGQGCLCA
jgi:hypothetical protein